MQRLREALHRRRRHARGQSLVELALILPVLMLLFLGVIDLGRLYYSQITVQGAAREAAIQAAQDPTSYTAGTCDATTSKVVCAAVNEARNSFVTVAPGDVSLSCDPACTKTYGPEVTVTVTGHFSLLTPLMSAFTGGSDVTLTSVEKADVIYLPPVAGAGPTPTPTPTPEPTPEPTPGPTPEPTPAPTPEPTPTPCTPAFASFSYSQATKNSPVVFTSLSTPTTGECAINYWRWDFGDNSTEAGNLPTSIHDYGNKNRGKSFVVALTVTVPGGVTTTTYVTVTTKS